MAAMDQSKLDRMCSAINASAQAYVSEVSADVRDLTSTFNDNWVSNSARQLAQEITDALNALADAIMTTFSNKNEDIKVSVNNFNEVEGEGISYSGFEFGKPGTEIVLNNTLPNGKLGVADGADLNTINTPMGSLVNNVNNNLDAIKNAVNGADAFDMAEAQALTDSVTRIKDDFNAKMEELENSLSTRMSGEIGLRENLDSTNQSNLGA